MIAYVALFVTVLSVMKYAGGKITDVLLGIAIGMASLLAAKKIRVDFWAKNCHPDLHATHKLMTLPKISETITDELDAANISDGQQIRLAKVLFRKEESRSRRKLIKNVVFEECLFSHQFVAKITFQNCSFTDCQFNGAEIVECEFHQCAFHQCCFYKTQISGSYLDPRSFDFDSRWYRAWANVNAWWFQALYRNARDIHQDNFAMHADKLFQFYERNVHLRGRKKQPIRYCTSVLYDVVLGYGYGVWNVLLSTFVLVGVFAAVITGLTSEGQAAGIVQHVYFAVVSFTTVGYGEITPADSTLALILTTVFLFLSTVWGAIVTAVVVKRVVD